MTHARLPRLKTFAGAIAALAAASLAACAPGGAAGGAAGVDPSCVAKLPAERDTSFSLVSQDGERITQDTFKGKKTLVFFGYTYCPDFCPTAMIKLGQMESKLPADKQPQILFVSVDPERDTPEQLRAYVTSNGFPKNLTAATGSPDEVKAAVNALYGYAQKAEGSSSAAGYLVDHVVLIYLMDENWKLQTYFRDAITPDDLAKCVAGLS